MWVWRALPVMFPWHVLDFQYPRRIECGCGPQNNPYTIPQYTAFSILGGSSVGVARSVSCSKLSTTPLSVSSADRVWVWHAEIAPHTLGERLSVSSADRVWVWPLTSSRTSWYSTTFSILGGSSVGVARFAVVVARIAKDFQYPRRIECGCGSFHVMVS